MVGINKYMNFKDLHQRNQTDLWLANNGINVAHIYAGTAELFQATKLATTTLKEWGKLLDEKQVQALNQFLKSTKLVKSRDKITQGQCFKVMNIAKQVQRKSAKLSKRRLIRLP